MSPHTHLPARPRALGGLAAVAAAAVLGGVAACGEQAALATDLVADRTPPRVSVADARPESDTVLGVVVGASDNLGLKTVRVRTSGGVALGFDTTFTTTVTGVQLPVAFAVSRAVPPGTSVLVVATAVDGAGNAATPDTLRLVVGNLAPPTASTSRTSTATSSRSSPSPTRSSSRRAASGRSRGGSPPGRAPAPARWATRSSSRTRAGRT